MTRLHGTALTLLVALGLPAAVCSAQESAGASSRAYRGHPGERDVATFVSVYRAAIGSRLDDCQTCHRGGTFTEVASGRTVTRNPCDFCHLTQHPVAGYAEPLPASIRATLNAYGLAYLERGRNAAALRAIDGLDSDGDGAPNGAEIAALRYPGDPASRPGQRAAPARHFTMAQIRTLPSREEFLLVNASRQASDYYARYRGVRVRDLLVAAGVDPDAPGFEGVTVFAPDGYRKDLPARQVNAPFPAAPFFGGLDAAALGADCGFVQYPDPLPPGIRDGAPIPGEPWMLLAYEREGGPMDVVSLGAATGRIRGEGPFRVVVPQSTPGAPDRGSAARGGACPGGHAYDPAADHNADPMVRGVIAIRVDPLPAGVEDFDVGNGGWAFVESASVVVYGFGVRTP